MSKTFDEILESAEVVSPASVVRFCTPSDVAKIDGARCFFRIVDPTEKLRRSVMEMDGEMWILLDAADVRTLLLGKSRMLEGGLSAVKHGVRALRVNNVGLLFNLYLDRPRAEIMSHELCKHCQTCIDAGCGSCCFCGNKLPIKADPQKPLTVHFSSSTKFSETITVRIGDEEISYHRHPPSPTRMETGSCKDCTPRGEIDPSCALCKGNGQVTFCERCYLIDCCCVGRCQRCGYLP